MPKNFDGLIEDDLRVLDEIFTNIEEESLSFMKNCLLEISDFKIIIKLKGSILKYKDGNYVGRILNFTHKYICQCFYGSLVSANEFEEYENE